MDHSLVRKAGLSVIALVLLAVAPSTSVVQSSLLNSIFQDRTVLQRDATGPASDSCRYAEAEIDGQRILLQAEPGEDVTRVRYAWADSPIVTLYDASGDPAGPFEIALSGNGR